MPEGETHSHANSIHRVWHGLAFACFTMNTTDIPRSCGARASWLDDLCSPAAQPGGGSEGAPQRHIWTTTILSDAGRHWRADGAHTHAWDWSEPCLVRMAVAVLWEDPLCDVHPLHTDATALYHRPNA